MNTPHLALLLALVVTLNSGCHLLRLMPRQKQSTLEERMSLLNSALRRREITLDEFERSQHAILHATDQRPATNAR